MEHYKINMEKNHKISKKGGQNHQNEKVEEWE